MARFRATPYAKALHEIVASEDPKRGDETLAELERMADAIDAVPDLLKVMVTPMVTTETKAVILDQVLETLALSDLCCRFIRVVQQHYRLQHMRQIADVYREILDRSLGRSRATVEVAATLDDGERRQVLDHLASFVGNEVIAEFVDNPKLLAGFRVQVGSQVFDGSLVGQLDRLSRQTQIEQG